MLSAPGLNIKPVAPVVAKVEVPLVVTLPMLSRLPVLSMRCVPAPAPVLMPVVPFRVVPVMVPLQARLPLPLLMVQPVEPLPPANKTLPAEMPPMETVPVVPASTVRLVAAAATAMAPLETVNPLMVPLTVNMPPTAVVTPDLL